MRVFVCVCARARACMYVCICACVVKIWVIWVCLTSKCRVQTERRVVREDSVVLVLKFEIKPNNVIILKQNSFKQIGKYVHERLSICHWPIKMLFYCYAKGHLLYYLVCIIR